jgi:hypothetical protein
MQRLVKQGLPAEEYLQTLGRLDGDVAAALSPT